MLRTRLWILWMVVVLAACGGEDVATDGDVDTLRVDTVAVLDSLIDGPVKDTLADVAEGEGSDAGEGLGAGDAPSVDDAPPPIESSERDPAAKEEPDDPAPDPNSERPPPLAARYQLASVEGESLPVTIGMGEECELQLANGNLWIKENLDFELRTTVQEVCAGERASDDVHRAEGTVSRDDAQLTFQARYDSLFATASGRFLPEGHIVIETLETEGGEQDVEWRFLR